MTIPKSVTSIKASAFKSSLSLAVISIDEDNPAYSSVEGVLFNKTKTTLIQYPRAKEGKSYTILINVTAIEDGAFVDCDGLAAISVDKRNPFYSSAGGVLFDKAKTRLIRYPSAKKRTSYRIPNSVTTIGASAFRGCYHLTSVTIPGSVTSIEDSTFADCFGLISVNERNPSYCSVGGVLFNKTKTRLIRYPSVKAGTTYSIPNSVATIGAFAFEHCSGLTSVTIPDGVTTIEDSSFYGCSLTNVTIPNSVTTIGASALSSCSSLTSVTIPSSVTSIGRFAFGLCSGLTNVNISKRVTEIGDDVFYQCMNLAVIKVDEDNPSYSSLQGVLLNKAKTMIIHFPRARVGDYTVPDSVTAIGNHEFDYCTGLTSVTIPNSVTTMGNHAFAYCKRLRSVTISANMTSIGNSAFESCYSLVSVIIPNGVPTIGDSAFASCFGLTSVTIPNSVNRIGNAAFLGCMKLAGVYFQGNSPIAGSQVFDPCPCTVYYLPGTTGWESTFARRPAVLWNPETSTKAPDFGVKNDKF